MSCEGEGQGLERFGMLGGLEKGTLGVVVTVQSFGLWRRFSWRLCRFVCLSDYRIVSGGQKRSKCVYSDFKYAGIFILLIGIKANRYY